MDYEIEIIKSNRKTVSLEIKKRGTLTVRVPLYISDRKIQKILAEKDGWIQKHIRLSYEKPAMASESCLSENEIERLKSLAMQVLPEMVQKYASVLAVDYGKVTIRSQKTRWGSCSGKGNLNFNCLLMLAPTYVQEYVVVHELAHRKEMNHSARFWAIVAQTFPEYQAARKWLKQNGSGLINRL